MITVATIAALLVTVAAVFVCHLNATRKIIYIPRGAATKQGASSTSMHPFIASAEMPNSTLTPGTTVTADLSVICRPGYATSVRPSGALWTRIKNEAYDLYGLPHGHRSVFDGHDIRQPAYEVDHLIPLEIGGDPTDLRNIWPEPIDSAREKDEVENELHGLVCGGQMPIERAQAAIAHDWKTAVPGQQIP